MGKEYEQTIYFFFYFLFYFKLWTCSRTTGAADGLGGERWHIRSCSRLREVWWRDAMMDWSEIVSHFIPDLQIN